jgi:hypothetical protein
MSRDLQEARSEAEAILKLSPDQLNAMFFEQAMRRNLSRTVRHLDKLVEAGGDDKKLGKTALKKLGFWEN